MYAVDFRGKSPWAQNPWETYDGPQREAKNRVTPPKEHTRTRGPNA